jgi:hypothetical protein
MKETLTHEQKDFICRKLAQFIPHKRIAEEMLTRFPEIELTPDELIYRIKYYSANPKAAKWQQRVQIYRDILNTQLTKHFAHTHTFKRMRVLERILEQSLKPSLQKVLWYPDGRDESGRLNYTHKEVHRIDSAAAIRALTMINREMEQLAQGIRPPSPYTENLSKLSDEQLRQCIQTRQKLSTQLDAIELDHHQEAQ